MAIENITILNGEFHNLNLVFHKEILVSGLRKHFHSIQNVRIRLYTDFGGLRMAEKITPFFLPKCPQNSLILPSAPEEPHSLRRELSSNENMHP